MSSKIFNGKEQIVAKCLMQDMVAIVSNSIKQDSNRLSLPIPVLSDTSLQYDCKGIIDAINNLDCSNEVDDYIKNVAKGLSAINKTNLDDELERVAKTICFFVEQSGRCYDKSPYSVYDKASSLLRAEIYKYGLYCTDVSLCSSSGKTNGIGKNYSTNSRIAEFFSAFASEGEVEIFELGDPCTLIGYNNDHNYNREGYPMVRPFDRTAVSTKFVHDVFFNKLKSDPKFREILTCFETDFILYFDGRKNGEIFADKLYEAGVLDETDYFTRLSNTKRNKDEDKVRFWDTMVRRKEIDNRYYKVKTKYGEAYISVYEVDRYRTIASLLDLMNASKL